MKCAGACCWKGVGITSSAKQISKDGCIHDTLSSYYWDGQHDKVAANNKDGKEEKKYGKGPTWGKNQIATVLVDCIKWKLFIWHGDKLIANIDIKKNLSYYPLLSCCHCSGNSDFRLL